MDKSPLWRRIESGAWRQRVVLDFYLEPGAIEANAENEEHCFYDGKFNCRLHVVRTKKLGGGSVNVIAVECGEGEMYDEGSSGGMPAADDIAGQNGDAHLDQSGERRKRNRAHQPSRSRRRRRKMKELATEGASPTASP